MRASLFAKAAVIALLSTASASAATVSDQARAFVEERLASVLSSPQVIDAIRAQNESSKSLSQADIEALDQQWRAGDSTLIDGVLSNELSGFLAGIVADGEGAFSEIFVMDMVGLNVGQSDRTSDYWQGDEDKWTATYQGGSVHVSDVEEDESTQTFQVQVSMPITDGGATIGAITVGVDVSYLE